MVCSTHPCVWAVFNLSTKVGTKIYHSLFLGLPAKRLMKGWLWSRLPCGCCCLEVPSVLSFLTPIPFLIPAPVSGTAPHTAKGDPDLPVEKHGAGIKCQCFLKVLLLVNAKSASAYYLGTLQLTQGLLSSHIRAGPGHLSACGFHVPGSPSIYPGPPDPANTSGALDQV